MRKKIIDVSTIESCNDFIESRGFTAEYVIDYKKTHSAKELAKLLHTSPNVVGDMMKTLGITYGKKGLSRATVTSAKKEKETAKRRENLLKEWPKDKLVSVVKESYRGDVERLIPHRGDLDWIMSHYEITFPEQRSIRVIRNEREWKKKYASIVDKMVNSNVPVKVIIKATSNQYPATCAQRYLMKNHPDYHTSPSIATILLENSRNFPRLKALEFASVANSMQGVPLQLVASIFQCTTGSICRYSKTVGIDADSMYPVMTPKSIVEWCMKHKNVFTSLFHFPMKSTVRTTLESRLTDWESSDVIKSFRHKVNGMATIGPLLSDGYIFEKLYYTSLHCELSSDERASFGNYISRCMSLKDVGVQSDNAKVAKEANEWARKNDLHVPIDVADDNKSIWYLYMLHQDKRFLDTLKSKLDATNLTIGTKTRYINEYDVRTVYCTDKETHIEFNFNRNCSSFEQQVRDILNGFGVYYETQCRCLDDGFHKREIDVLIPSLKIGIEVSPTHTHNSTYGWNKSPETALAYDYHMSKFKMAEASGIKLITLYEHDLIEPTWTNITVPFLKYLVTGPDYVFYARQTRLEAISGSVANEFIESNHFQGRMPSKWYLGWYGPNDVMLGVAALNPTGESDIKLERMVFLPDVQVRYGLSKLVSDIPEIIGTDDGARLLSFSRNDMGTGDAYKKAGFTFVRETGPTLRYVNPVDANDSYSWQVGTPWSAKSGVISRAIGTPSNMTKKEADEYMQTSMSHRHDNGYGYVKVFNSGNKLWAHDL